jgi:hypothetical protein
VNAFDFMSFHPTEPQSVLRQRSLVPTLDAAHFSFIAWISLQLPQVKHPVGLDLLNFENVKELAKSDAKRLV